MSGCDSLDRATARMLLDIGHGIGVLSAHAMLRNHKLFKESDLVVSAQEVADAFRHGGESAVADAIEQFIRDEYAKLTPPIDGTAREHLAAPSPYLDSVGSAPHGSAESKP